MMSGQWTAFLACLSLCCLVYYSDAIHHIDPYDIHDYKNHPCNRPCMADALPMNCSYYFLVEHFTTLGAACYGCPDKAEHCYLPQCVPGNGYIRPTLTVNRMIPGPGINVCKGDTIEVLVDNRMELGEGTSIHWHGLRQKGTPFMDGTAMITQCPITKWSKMTYRFIADEAGSYFWHSHSALQRADGLFGSLVVRQPAISDPQSALYDLDLPEHTIMLNDWAKGSSVDSIVNLFHTGGGAYPSGILVNGFGQSNSDVKIPYPEFSVKAGLRYRFRVIYSGILNCPIYVRVDGHKLLMIAGDGVDFQPVEVDSFFIFSGERYDFVLTTKGEGEERNSSYWMRFKGLISCGVSETIQPAILRYDPKDTKDPPWEVTYDNTKQSDEEMTLNDEAGVSSEHNYQISDLKSLGADEKEADLLDEPDKKFYISIVKSTQPDPRFITPMNPECVKPSPINSTEYTSERLGLEDKCYPTNRYSLQLNYITGRLPPVPPLTQFDEIDQRLMCNSEDIVGRNCSTDVVCVCAHTLRFSQGDLVELILLSPQYRWTGATPEPVKGLMKATGNQLIHPLHIHGHSPRVVSMTRLGDNITMEIVKEMDERGAFKRTRSHAPYKDTIPTGDHSVVILRFRADNPGFWFFHCHVELHTELGMLLILQSGEPSEMPQPPDDFPKCSPWTDEGAGLLTDWAGELNEKLYWKSTTPNDSGSDDDDNNNNNNRPFITSSNIGVILVALLISLALPAMMLGGLLWYKRRQQQKHMRSPYKRLMATSNGGTCRYHSYSNAAVAARLSGLASHTSGTEIDSDISET